MVKPVFYTIQVPLEVDEEVLKALTAVAKETNSTPGEVYAQIIKEEEILESDRFFDAQGNFFEAHGINLYEDEDIEIQEWKE